MAPGAGSLIYRGLATVIVGGMALQADDSVDVGDWIELDCEAGRLHLDISDAELADRMATMTLQPAKADSGYQKLHVDHVLQADEGCDLDFLVGCRGSAVPRHSH